MQANPFDDESGDFFVLMNHEEHHSLCSAFADVPAGWRVVYGEADRAARRDYIEQKWTDHTFEESAGEAGSGCF
jgi:uncharacterized protein YbdZ (MbtH family)